MSLLHQMLKKYPFMTVCYNIPRFLFLQDQNDAFIL